MKNSPLRGKSLINAKSYAALLSVVLVGSVLAAMGMALAQPALAASPHGDSKDGVDPNFDIKNFHREGNGQLVMEVFGQAGGTVPVKPEAGHLGQVFVYIFYTDNGIWVTNAHGECHAVSGCDPSEQHVSEWHAERVTVANVAGYDKPCVTSISGERTATVDGHKAIVNVPEATKVISAQTAAYDLKTNPDNPTQLCIAEFDQAFDDA